MKNGFKLDQPRELDCCQLLFSERMIKSDDDFRDTAKCDDVRAREECTRNKRSAESQSLGCLNPQGALLGHIKKNIAPLLCSVHNHSRSLAPKIWKPW